MGESKDENRLSSVISSECTRGNGHSHKTKRLVSLLKHKEKHPQRSYCKSDQTLEQVSQRSCGVSILGAIQKPDRHSLEQSAVVGLTFSRGCCTRQSPEVTSHLSYSVAPQNYFSPHQVAFPSYPQSNS